MKKLLCVICLLAATLFVDTASACVSGRCGSYYGRPSYSHSYGRRFGHRVGFHGRRFGHRFGRRIGFRAHRAHRVSYCSYCGR